MRPHRKRARDDQGASLSLEENRSSGNPGPVSSGIVRLASVSPDIELWWCSLQPLQARLDVFERSLSEAERTRAARFGTPQLRDRYVMGRGSLRSILAGELDIDPAAVDIVRGTRGRPQLAGTPALDFNVSHTDGVAIVGIVRRGRIGVDIERLDRTINVEGIARKFMTANERAAIAAQDADAGRRRLLTLWTCKEAMSKATGDALAAPFGSIDVAIDTGRTLRSGPSPYRADHWLLHPLVVPPEYVATAAVWEAPGH
jgi:4'-phosphopantetheinyl transferase